MTSDELCDGIKDTDGLTMLKPLEVLVCSKGADCNALTVDEASELSTSVEVNGSVSDKVGLSVPKLLEPVICPAAAILIVDEALEPSTSMELSGGAVDADGLPVIKLPDSLVCSGAADSDASAVVGALELPKSAELCTGIALAAEAMVVVNSAADVWSKLSAPLAVVMEAEMRFPDDKNMLLPVVDIVLVEILGVPEVRDVLVVAFGLLIVVKKTELALVTVGTLAVETSEATLMSEAAKSVDVL